MSDLDVLMAGGVIIGLLSVLFGLVVFAAAVASDLADRYRQHRQLGWRELAYCEQPSERERRQHRDEARVRAVLRPRSGQVDVSGRPDKRVVGGRWL